jgi:P27 family predicted phage terminase small subunit
MRRLTDSQKIANGTFKPTRSTGEPVMWEQLTEVPEAPAHLDELGQQAWTLACEQLLKADKLFVPFLATVEGYAVAYSTWRAAYESVRVNGVDLVSQNMAGIKTIKPNPTVRLLNTALTTMLTYADRLGFNPKSHENIRIHSNPNGNEISPLIKFR